MKKDKLYFLFLFIGFIFTSCSSEQESNEQTPIADTAVTLATALANDEVVTDNVIACAGSNEDPALVSIYVYPRPEATNIRFFGTTTAEDDKNDFTLYTEMDAPLLPVFNGYLLRYEVTLPQEKWIIVSFEEDGVVHVSNPIRMKQITKPTEYLPENVTLDTTDPLMPRFNWVDGTFDDTIIYFHGVWTGEGDLLSGTYTFERTFQYYNLENVVLNITEETPPNLELGERYGFTLLSVSEDNWVNLYSEIDFEL